MRASWLEDCDAVPMGTDAWRNWRAFDDDSPEMENFHDELYSDRHFSGGPTTRGPYTLTSILGRGQLNDEPSVRPAIRMRVGLHASLIPELVQDGKLVSANSDSYHGGDASDEIAALASLTLGVRLRVAGTTQLSGIHRPGEKEGSVYLEVIPLATPGRPGDEYVPAALNRSAQLDQLERLDSFPTLNEQDQIALVRAARSYAVGLWWSNEDQNQAWLQFVTAMEIAATRRQKIKASAEDLVESLWPELWSSLQPAEESVRAQVAEQIAGQIRATRKFIDFVSQCAPAAPELRPEIGQLPWEEMANHAKLIYKHRSDALHGGKPFPLPMLERPRIEETGAIQEIPYGLSTGGRGGVWNSKEAPMLLSTFEHIARGCLLNWWDELGASQNAPTCQPT